MRNLYKPVRWIFSGDETGCQKMIGEAKRVLFQLKNIQNTGSQQYILGKKYVDGSSVNVRTDVRGLDIIKIKTPIPIPPKGKEIEIIPFTIYVGGYYCYSWVFAGYLNSVLTCTDGEPFLLALKPYRDTNGNIAYRKKWEVLGDFWIWAVHGDDKYVYTDYGIHDKKTGGLLHGMWDLTSLEYLADISSNRKSIYWNGHTDGYWRSEGFTKQIPSERNFLITRDDKYQYDSSSIYPHGWTVADSKRVFSTAISYVGSDPARVILECRNNNGELLWIYTDSDGVPGAGLSTDEFCTGLAIDNKYVYMSYFSVNIGVSKIVAIYKEDGENWKGGDIKWVTNSTIFGLSLLQGVAVSESKVYTHGEQVSVALPNHHQYTSIALDKETGALKWIERMPFSGGEEDGLEGTVAYAEGVMYAIGQFFQGPAGKFNVWEDKLVARRASNGSLLSIYDFGHKTWVERMALCWDTPTGELLDQNIITEQEFE